MKILEIKTIVIGKEVDEWLHRGSHILNQDELNQLLDNQDVKLKRSDGSTTYYKLTDTSLPQELKVSKEK